MVDEIVMEKSFLFFYSFLLSLSKLTFQRIIVKCFFVVHTRIVPERKNDEYLANVLMSTFLPLKLPLVLWLLFPTRDSHLPLLYTFMFKEKLRFYHVDASSQVKIELLQTM